MLVVQSFVMIATQLSLIHVCVRYMVPKGRGSIYEEFCMWDSLLIYCTV